MNENILLIEVDICWIVLINYSYSSLTVMGTKISNSHLKINYYGYKTFEILLYPSLLEKKNYKLE